MQIIGLNLGLKGNGVSGSSGDPAALFGDNGTFDDNVADWSGTRSGSVSHVATGGGRMRVESTSGVQFGASTRGFDTVEGHVYIVSGELKATSGAFGYMSLGTNATDHQVGEVKRIFESSTATSGTYYFIGDGSTLYVHCFAGIANGNWAEFDNITVTDQGFNLISAGNYGRFTTDVDGWVPSLGTAVLESSAIKVTQVGATAFGKAYAEFDTVIGNTYYCQGRSIAFNTANNYFIIGKTTTDFAPEYVRVMNNVGVVGDYGATFVATQDKAYFYVMPGGNDGNILFADNILATDLGVV